MGACTCTCLACIYIVSTSKKFEVILQNLIFYSVAKKNVKVSFLVGTSKRKLIKKFSYALFFCSAFSPVTIYMVCLREDGYTCHQLERKEVQLSTKIKVSFFMCLTLECWESYFFELQVKRLFTFFIEMIVWESCDSCRLQNSTEA